MGDVQDIFMVQVKGFMNKAVGGFKKGHLKGFAIEFEVAAEDVEGTFEVAFFNQGFDQFIGQFRPEEFFHVRPEGGLGVFNKCRKVFGEKGFLFVPGLNKLLRVLASIFPVTAAEISVLRYSLSFPTAVSTLAISASILPVSRSRKAAMACCSERGG